MEIMANVGGTPGKDCGGFCEYCYFKTLDIKKLENITCRYCPPHQKGCIHCNNLKQMLNGFRNPYEVLIDFQKNLIMQSSLGMLNFKDLKIVVGSMGDITFYPSLKELIYKLKQFGLPIHLGYTTGKGIKNEKMIYELLNLNIDSISFSVFSCNPEIRRRWMHDKSPELSLKAVEIFCESIDVHASTVVIPGVTDLQELLNTGNILEEWGVKTLILDRFGNFQSQGNILNNRPIIDGIFPHSYEEFQDIVLTLHNEFNFRVLGLPLFYPENDIPFILSKSKNKFYLRNLPDITSEATIITGKYAEKYLKKIFNYIDENNFVNIIAVNKEIGDLITPDDLHSLNLKKVKNKVIIPGNAMMRDDQAVKILNKHGTKKVIRGPDSLTPIDEQDVINKERAIDFELRAFTNLINIINS